MIHSSAGRSLGPRYGPLLILAAIAAVPFGCSTSSTAPATKAGAESSGRFVWHDLTTGDPAVCKKFYTALLGWEYSDTTVLGHPYSVARIGTTPVGGIHAPSAEIGGKTPAHWLAYMSVADVDASVARAKAQGGGVLAGTRKAPLSVSSIFLREILPNRPPSSQAPSSGTST